MAIVNLGSSPGFKKIVQDKRILKDMQQMTQFCHTGNLEVFHSMMLKYSPKRQHFSHSGMIARTRLAVLDNNENANRNQSTTSAGNERYKVDWGRRKEWFAKEVNERKDYSYLSGMMRMWFVQGVKTKVLGFTLNSKACRWHTTHNCFKT